MLRCDAIDAGCTDGPNDQSSEVSRPNERRCRPLRRFGTEEAGRADDGG